MPRLTGKLILFSALYWLVAVLSPVAAPHLINYQGLLTDSEGRTVADSSYQIDFGIFSDSVEGDQMWQESATIETKAGVFSHLLGESSPLPADLFDSNQRLFLQVSLGGQALLPRVSLVSVPYALSSAGLSAVDSLGVTAIRTFADEHRLVLYDSVGTELIVLQNSTGNQAVILPESAIGSEEILDEPGIALNNNVYPMSLPTGEMTDLVTVTLTTPDDGYIALYGKCYLLLSGTTGPNTALVQIDENEGGASQFPYYAIAGLSGYVNSGTNYFPIFVTRVYFKKAGTYTFRMEGRASYALPAAAQSWDHVLLAVYYPTSYYGVRAILPEAVGFPSAIPLIIDDTTAERRGTYYDVDLRDLEKPSEDKE